MQSAFVLDGGGALGDVELRAVVHAAQRVGDLDNRLCDLCRPSHHGTTPEQKPHERAFANLIDELLRLLRDGELFTFVLVPGVEPTTKVPQGG